MKSYLEDWDGFVAEYNESVSGKNLRKVPGVATPEMVSWIHTYRDEGNNPLEATVYLPNEFGISRKDAITVTAWWVESYESTLNAYRDDA